MDGKRISRHPLFALCLVRPDVLSFLKTTDGALIHFPFFEDIKEKNLFFQGLYFTNLSFTVTVATSCARILFL